MGMAGWLALAVFLGTLILSATGRMKTATAALLGAALMMSCGLISGEKAVEAIDHNTIGLLVGMMIVVGVLSKSGLFEYAAVKAVKMTRGDPVRLFWALSLLTALLSSFLDNVTTVLLVTPVVLSLASLVGISPMPLLFVELFSSNIGGAATLIGDPPNMIVASAAGFAFNDFLIYAAPAAVTALLLCTAYLRFYFKRRLVASPDASDKLSEVDEERLIKDRRLMRKSLIIMAFVIAAFLFHSYIKLEPSIVALTAAAVLLAVSLIDSTEIIHKDVEWPTIIYFISLFIMAGGLRENGVLEELAKLIIKLSGGNPTALLLSVLWISGISCIFINNIAFAAIFVNVIAQTAAAANMAPAPLYWALALGACLGGNGSYFGAAANAVVADFAHKEGAGLSVAAFSRVGVQVVFISLVCASFFILASWRGSL